MKKKTLHTATMSSESSEEKSSSSDNSIKSVYVKKFKAKEALKQRFGYLTNELYSKAEDSHSAKLINKFTVLAKNRRKNEIFEEILVESDDGLEEEYEKALNLLEFDMDPVIQTPEMEEKITRGLINDMNVCEF